MKAVPKASHTEQEGFWHGSTEMSRRIAKPDHTGSTLGDMTEGRSEAEGHRRLHTRTHRRDSLSEHDQVHGLARTMFVCDAPPLSRCGCGASDVAGCCAEEGESTSKQD